MLLTESRQPTESDEWLNELKFDGIRCIAYLDSGSTELRNKRDFRLLPAFPELSELHEAVHAQCILDGELIITDTQGKPDFETLQARSMMTDTSRIRLKASQAPASFVAFDILYQNGKDLMSLPLQERKQLLREIVEDKGRLAVSRTMESNASALFELTRKQGLEGIVQKRKASLYRPAKRSPDWVKVKNLIDEDFLACGYIIKSPQVTSLVLGAWVDGRLEYKGHVTLGVPRLLTESLTTKVCPFELLPPGNEEAIWYRQPLVCTVTFMERTSAGGMRQPRFKCFRNDIKLH